VAKQLKRKSPAFSTNKVSVLKFSPTLAKEAHRWDPAFVSKGSGKKLEWKCRRKGHVWKAQVHSRVKGAGCPYCAGQRLMPGENDLATTHPDIASEAFGWDPKEIRAGSGVKLKWKCKKEHTWITSPDARTGINKSGCPFCSHKQTWPGFNDLKTLYPHIAQEAYKWDPSKFGPGSHEKKEWRCKKGHVYRAVIYNRTAGRNCSVCKGNQVLTGINDLQTTNPKLAKEAFGWDPKKIIAGHNKKLKWKCKKGHTWLASPNQRTSSKTNCPYCAGLLKIAGENDLAALFPVIAKMAYGWSPLGVAPSSHQKLKWLCPVGHIYITSPAKKTNSLASCPFCSGQKLLSGFNDLKTRFPKIAKEAYGWDPSKVQWGAGVKLTWRCKKNHIYKTSSNSRTNKKTGCPSCATSGFNPRKEAWIYLLRHPKWKMNQIGITNVPKQRLSSHRRSGWVEIEKTGPLLGSKAREIEKSILTFLIMNGAIMGPASKIRSFDGYTESWIEKSLPVNSLAGLILKANQHSNSK
jgi:hypothetical protein